MTDKVQKIKEWISKEQDGLMDAQGNFEYPEHEGAYHILCNLDAYIDSLQEEPASSVWHDASEPPIIDKTFLLVAPNGNSSLCLWGGKELHSVTIGGGHSVLRKGDIYSYIDDLLNLDNFCNFRKNLQEEPVRRTLADIESAMQEVEEKSKAFTEAHQGEDADTILAQMRGEEPVNKDLEEAALLHLSKYYDTSIIWDEDKKCVVRDFKEGALWHQNSIWHDANKEEPKIGKAFATIDSKGVMYAEYHVFEGGLTFKQMKEMDDIVKWAYTEDLIPKD